MPTKFIIKPSQLYTTHNAVSLSRAVDQMRIEAIRKLPKEQRARLGQFLTPEPVARLMASMSEQSCPDVSILDAGAGVGSLFATVVENLCNRDSPPHSITVTAYEIDPYLAELLNETMRLCESTCRAADVSFSGKIVQTDFLADAAQLQRPNLFNAQVQVCYSCAILNPPYSKINSGSTSRRFLRSLGIETSNTYTGFVAAAVQFLQPGGELIAITPRSFCNGQYFRSFRREFLSEIALRRIHVFDSRTDAFRDDDVLQETIIVCGVKSREKSATVRVSTSVLASTDSALERDIPYAEVVSPDDPEQFIRVVADGLGKKIALGMSQLPATLSDLRISVSTGRVVDFRATEWLRANPAPDAAPLLYPTNLELGAVRWPKETRKPQAIQVTQSTRGLLVPKGNYVLVKRLSAKEEKRRVIAAVLTADVAREHNQIGIENHLNYFHSNGSGLDIEVARGLAAFLNCTVVDDYVRQFNGHTQVNATDLRNIRYPAYKQLESIGRQVGDETIDQEAIDRIVNEEIFGVEDQALPQAVRAKQHIAEALDILTKLGFPRPQINERSALTLLALLDMKPATRWTKASAPLRGITRIMDFMDTEYGKKYAPNTRETVRRQTMHQFWEAGIVVANPDEPTRPINSGKFAYQIESSVLELVRTYGSDDWNRNLDTYLASVDTLRKKYAQERDLARIPLEVAPGKTITLSPGGQNVLIERVINEFGPRFTPGGKPVYIGDTDDKFVFIDSEQLKQLGIEFDSHGKMPDVIIYYAEKNWLVLIEAVTSHGPINPKRKTELEQLFAASTAGLVLVTTFLSRKAMIEYIQEISWETEVWVAEDPTHMIHFNGERFLGPY